MGQEQRPTEQINDVVYSSYFKDSENDKIYQRTRSEVSLADSPSVDAFQRVRVSNPNTLFDASLYTGISDVLFTTSTATSGTVAHESNKKAAVLTVINSSGSQAILQSRQHINYIPGKSQLIIMTGNLKSASGTYAIGVRTKISGTISDGTVAQSSWNLDTLDGTGSSSNPSGITLSLNKQNIFIICYQWLGSGRILFGFDIDGKIVYVHQVLNANVLEVMYSQTAILPLRYEVTRGASSTIKRVGQFNTNNGFYFQSTETAGATTIEATCMTVISEGGENPIGIPKAIRIGTTPRSIASSISNFPLLSIRKKTATIDVPLKIQEANIFLASNDQVLVDVVFNPTLPSATFANDPGGIAEYDTAATTFTSGTIIHSQYLAGPGGSIDIASAFNDTALSNLGCSVAGVSDIVTIVISNLTTTTSVYGAINYKELL